MTTIEEPSYRQKQRFQKAMGIDSHTYGFELCEVCKKPYGKDGICKDCGLPSKENFLRALKQSSEAKK